MALGVTASVVGIATGVNSLMNSGGSAGGNVAGGGYYDPYASERPQYFAGLQTLMGKGGTPGTPGTPGQTKPLTYAEWAKENPTSGGNNPYWYNSFGVGGPNKGKYHDYVANFKPTEATAGTEGVSGNQAAINMVMNSPTYMGGYQSGQRTLNAGLARTGQTESGAEKLALQNYGQDYFNQQYQNLYNQYTGLSQATAAPLNMANQNQLNATNDANSWKAIAGGVQGLSGAFNSSSSQPYTPNNYVSGYTPSPGYSGYSPTNTNIGMGGYSGDANMGGGTIGPNWGASDRRLKTNIKLIGKYKNGLNKYTWTYLWGVNGTGAMADEVEKLIPNAVAEFNGFKAVNYALLGD
jgi:hypothetical protein